MGWGSQRTKKTKRQRGARYRYVKSKKNPSKGIRGASRKGRAKGKRK